MSGIIIIFVSQCRWNGFTSWPAIEWSSRVKSLPASFRLRITTTIIGSSAPPPRDPWHSNHDPDRPPAGTNSSRSTSGQHRQLIIRCSVSRDQRRARDPCARCPSSAPAAITLIGATRRMITRRPATAPAVTVTSSTKRTAVISCCGSSIPKESRSIGKKKRT